MGAWGGQAAEGCLCGKSPDYLYVSVQDAVQLSNKTLPGAACIARGQAYANIQHT